MSNCKICSTPLKSIRAKTCESSKCKSAWKMERNKNLAAVTKECKTCSSKFETVDRRNNYCSYECKYKGSAKKMMEKYGVENPAQLTRTWQQKQKMVERMTATNIEKYGCISAKSYTYHTERGFSSKKHLADAIFQYCDQEQLSPYSQVVFDKFDTTVFFIQSIIEEYERRDLLFKFKGSSQEFELRAFLDEIGITSYKSNNRFDFLDGLELDLFIEDKKLAIEHHGLAFHSAKPMFDRPKNLEKVKNRHLDKYKMCKKADIKLIQVFEDEWRDRKDIVKSMIKSRLNMSSNIIYARNCQIKEVAIKDAKIFTQSTHIAGYTQASYFYGLYHENELVSLVSLRSTWNKKYGDKVIEIARFSSKLDTQVLGGFSKLLKYAKEKMKLINIETILTYADCRFGSGEVYLKSGFKHIGHTGANYFYEKNGIREGRYSHRKNNNLPGTEVEQNSNNGWHQIYDAGSEIYLMNL